MPSESQWMCRINSILSYERDSRGSYLYRWLGLKYETDYLGRVFKIQFIFDFVWKKSTWFGYTSWLVYFILFPFAMWKQNSRWSTSALARLIIFKTWMTTGICPSFIQLVLVYSYFLPTIYSNQRLKQVNDCVQNFDWYSSISRSSSGWATDRSLIW